MLIKFNGKDHEFNLENIMVSQARVIKAQTGLTLLSLEQGLEEGDPDALRAIFWLMKVQSGEAIPFERIDFKIIDFANSLRDATTAEENDEAKPKDEETAPEAPKDEA